MLSKALPLFILPEGIVILLLSLSLRTKYHKNIYLAILILWSLSTGISHSIIWNFVEYPWYRLEEMTLNNADAIVVLSGNRNFSENGSGIVEWSDPDRFFAGIELMRKRKAPKLIFTGGYNPLSSSPQTEGELNRKDAIKMGLPPESILKTIPVSNTKQEAIAIKKLINSLQKSKGNKIILVTSAYHMNRAKTIFERNELKVIPFPVDFKSREKNIINIIKNPLNWLPDANYLASNSIALREIIGRIYYQIPD